MWAFALLMTVSFFRSTLGFSLPLVTPSLVDLINNKLNEIAPAHQFRIRSVGEVCKSQKTDKPVRLDQLNSSHVYVICESNPNHREKTNLQLEIMAYVANQRLVVGDELSNANYSKRWVGIVPGYDLRSLVDIIAPETPINLGMYEMKSSLALGQMISQYHIRSKPSVLKGQSVEVLLRDGDLVIRAQGKVDRSASIGEIVTVNLKSSKSNLQGKVVNQQTVEVQ